MPTLRLVTPLGRFEIKAGETLLAALERTGHRVEYQCRSGYCGACRLRMNDPRAIDALHYPTTPLALLSPGELLPCCCYARRDIELALPEFTLDQGREEVLN
ncbi:MAG: class I ribonucleotide reductase maintenance protein YfaE [Aeromonadaceae bacterium]